MREEAVKLSHFFVPAFHCDLFSEFWSDYWQKVKLGKFSFFWHFSIAKVLNLHALTKEKMFYPKKYHFFDIKVGQKSDISCFTTLLCSSQVPTFNYFYHLGKNGEKF